MNGFLRRGVGRPMVTAVGSMFADCLTIVSFVTPFSRYIMYGAVAVPASY